MLLAEDAATESGMWLLLAVLGLVTFMLIFIRMRYTSTARQRRSPREQIARVRAGSELGGSLDELMVQLEAFSRRVNAQVDTRFVRLETIVRDADERIARLQRVLTQVDSLRTRIASQAPAPPAEPRPVSVPPVDDLHRKVYQLLDAGKTPVEAAEALQMTLGEVELILNLREFS
jgi:uncharacterized protein HemX